MKANPQIFRPATLPQTLSELRNNLAHQPTPEAAWEIIKEYFFCFGTESVQSEMWQLLSGTLTNAELKQFKKAEQRHNLVFFYEFTLLFTQAVHQLLSEQNNGSADDKMVNHKP